MAINPVQIQKYLDGADYPLKKEDLLKLAEKNNAPEDVMEVLKNLKNDSFEKPTEVSEAIGDLNDK